MQIAKSMGAEVTGVDSGIKEAFLRRIGVNHFIDYTQQDFTQLGRTWDVVFDMVPGSDYSACIRSLDPGGRYLSGNPRLAVMVRSIFTSLFSDRSATFTFAKETREELLALKEMIEQGKIQSIVAMD